MSPLRVLTGGKSNLGTWGCVRAYYYTSLIGDAPLIEDINSLLWSLEFTPHVFKKVRKDQKAKGVDISLTKDMLSDAFLNHYDVAVLVAGDGDYVPLVEAVKNRGKRVICYFFANNGMSTDLSHACDEFYDLSQDFEVRWRRQAKTP